MLTFDQRAQIFDKTVAKVTKEYFDPNFNGTKWPDIARDSRQAIIAEEDAEGFERSMHELVRRLGTSHTGFFHQSVKRVPARLAIGATFHKAGTNGDTQWIVQDVHEGGPAHASGLKPGDVIRTIGGAVPPSNEPPMFAMGTDVSMAIDRGSQELTVPIAIPAPRSRKQPTASLKPVTWSVLDGNTGYIKVPILPGMLGLDVARTIDEAMTALASCDRLILDLRGHVGGGLGVLRLMSHLTPDRIPIGYTVTRKRAERGYDKTALPKLDRLPTNLPNPLAIASMAIKFVGRDTSVALVSEGLGTKKWHGRAASLDHCEQFVASANVHSAARWTQYPWFQKSPEHGFESVAVEIDFPDPTIEHTERWVLFQSGQFVHNIALDRVLPLGKRTHVLEILEVLTALYEFTARMADHKILTGHIGIAAELLGVAGRQLAWREELNLDGWSQEDTIGIDNIYTAEELRNGRRTLALEAAISIYAQFGWDNPPREELAAAQRQRFGAK